MFKREKCRKGCFKKINGGFFLVLDFGRVLTAPCALHMVGGALSSTEEKHMPEVSSIQMCLVIKVAIARRR